ncbi:MULTISPECIES: Crp/Fnr family transcriptional regulator [Mesorhizobium]|uniref:Transcriptional regulator, Crp/Fnr family n=1 Tax=Mesorhizobium opportunistum (strain LMG 24607 / HAMBI 3007 / WSM2075) TaxID=536019 RepID=F7Y6T7_MESOW|nr:MULTISPECIES: Crp/Fnr family transcriptional regulator [Mesorhizobium]AEH87407.1 transcriptional regulator, Crp/Fnr family [Mesorhizobium opportunistum WSM2075]MCA0030296.1 Crp/Fnr family transcriptional regulator [Mesorhizobium sp. B263B2A]TPN50169.1 Crp/Fnr family transcriptional regulator [Mesorhizobium sp. B1-1-9]TPN53281.1 Crp/Fnr family transcriptional regulator [Mesorhizobium sp. B1-1-7]
MVSASHPFVTGNENRPSSTRLDDDDKDYIKALGFALRRYPAETAIVDQGQHAARVFIIESGWGCISHNLAGGQRQILDFALKGDVVLPHSFPGTAPETFVAQTDLAVFETSTKAFALAVAKSPRIASLFLETLVHQRALVAQHLTNVGRRSALTRTAHLLLELRTRLERVGGVARNGYSCPLTQYDLADALGLTPIHVNRMLRELRERKLLEFRQGHVRILDREGIAKFAGFDDRYVDS